MKIYKWLLASGFQPENILMAGESAGGGLCLATLLSLKEKKEGVDVTFRAGIGMVHCYPLLTPMFPEATEAMNEIVEFVRYQFKK